MKFDEKQTKSSHPAAAHNVVGRDYLWSRPCRSGWIGSKYSRSAVVLPNHQATVDAWQEINPGMAILAVECGGFSIEVSAAFSFIGSKQLLFVLEESAETDDTRGNAILYVPFLFAQQCKLSSEQIIHGWKIVIVADTPIVIKTDLNETTGHARVKNPFGIRLITAIRLWASQAIILSIPLWIFGWRSWAIGVVSMLVAAILLSIFWRLLPGPGWIKGVQLGFIVCGGVLGILALAMRMPLVSINMLIVGIYLLIVWMGVVFTGLRKV